MVALFRQALEPAYPWPRYLEGYQKLMDVFNIEASFGRERKRVLVVTGEPLSLTSPRTFGFQIGGIVNYALSKHVEVKSGLNIALYDRQIQFANEDLISRESTWLEIPMLLKFRSVRRQNHRMYLISGLKLGLEANVKKKNTAVTANTSEVSLEYGIGFERFYRFFKFSPEIRISHGLNNLFVPPGTVNSYSKLSQLNSHTISLIFNFE
jgi:hypothetical protein